MIGCRMLSKISKNLVKAKHCSPTLPFGGIDMIFAGDFTQFSPIQDQPLYYGQHPDTEMKPVKHQGDIDREHGRGLWSQLTHAVILHEQNRVTDEAFQELLVRLSEGKCTPEDVALLSTRSIGNGVPLDRFQSSPCIVPGNMLRVNLNNIHAKHHAKVQSTQLIISCAIDKGAKRVLKPSNINHLMKLPDNKTGRLPGECPLLPGMPVMLTTNIAVELGLTNSSQGIVREVVCDPSEKIQDSEVHKLRHLPKYVVVEFPNTKCPQLPNLPHKYIPIFPIHTSFQYRFPGAKKTESIARTQLPIVPSYCITSYKSQGKTLSSAIIDLVPPKRYHVDTSFSYVPLSRVRRLDDVVILRDFPQWVLNKKKSHDHTAQDMHFGELARVSAMSA